MALFKIFKGSAESFGKTELTSKTTEGYAYFTQNDGRFYIDIETSDTPILGTSTQFGANRIWINSGNLDNLLVDCGNAFGFTQHQLTLLRLGDSTDFVLEEGDVVEYLGYYDLEGASANDADWDIYYCGSSVN